MNMLQETISRAMEGKKVMALDLVKLLGRLNSMRRSHGSLPGVLTRTCHHLLGVAVNMYGWKSRLLLTYEAVVVAVERAPARTERTAYFFVRGQEESDQFGRE